MGFGGQNRRRQQGKAVLHQGGVGQARPETPAVAGFGNSNCRHRGNKRKKPLANRRLSPYNEVIRLRALAAP